MAGNLEIWFSNLENFSMPVVQTQSAEQERMTRTLSHFNNLELVYMFEQVPRVTVRAKAAVEAAGGSVRRVYYNKLGFRALLKPEWFEKKGRLLPKAVRPPPKLSDKVYSIGRLPAPTKPIPFVTEEKKGNVCFN
ncbi:Ribosomal protein L18e/L15 superfamily protein [Perilla frutescens var. hirtella]|uniref:Ribosomal protein L18e/L15 superfamily protein n=1 Tax=Perilla frutescens var. hirtella TaxID=608512 RepID=A0AAD4JB08_PERFH|nr:Ribosomal protein L18e/L15 superfamily protein [Perilla frutescens var. hirtella]